MNTNKQIIKVFIIAFIFSNNALSQEFITGKIVDKNTQNTLAYVNVFFQDTQVGTTTNEEGFFEFEYPLSQKKDSLTISYVGYKTIKVPINNVYNYNNIKIEEETTGLDEIIINTVPPTAEKIMQSVFSNIRKNHFGKTKPRLGYMNYTFFDEERCIALGEASFVFEKDKITHLKSRGVSNKKRFKEINKLLGKRKSRQISSNPEMLVDDVRKLDVPNHVKLNENKKKKQSDLNKNFEFKYDGYLKYNNRMNYVILFKFFKKERTIFQGRLLIDTETYGCASYDFIIPKGTDPNKIIFSGFSRFFMSMFSSFKMTDLTREIKAEFRLENENWVLSNGKIITGAKLRIKKKYLDGLAVQNYIISKDEDISSNKGVLNSSDFSNNFWNDNFHIPLSEKHKEYLKIINQNNN
jgi:hypothetical protein